MLRLLYLQGASFFCGRYEAYKKAETVAEALSLGCKKGDLVHDQSKGYLIIDPAKQLRPTTAGSAPAKSSNLLDRLVAKKPTVDEVARSVLPPREISCSSDSGASDLRQPASPMRKRPAEALLSPRKKPKTEVGEVGEVEAESPVTMNYQDIVTQVAKSVQIFKKAVDCPDEDVASTVPDESEEQDLQLTDRRQQPHQAQQRAEGGEEDGAASAAGALNQALANEVQDTRVTRLEDGEAEGEDEIVLRLQFGFTSVKQEEESDEDSNQQISADKVRTSSSSSAKDLPQMFKAQQEQSEEQSLPDEAESEELSLQAKAELEEAQRLSYEAKESERRRREEEDQDLLKQGSIEPLENLDEDLVLAIAERMMSWLESTQNRQSLFKYLSLSAKVKVWYKEKAQAYFEAKRSCLVSLLELGDASEAVAKFLDEETAAVEAAVFEMPAKGMHCPKLFGVEGVRGNVDVD
ncbi:para [Symbiodinium microadriaticum]|nr:para [Symbiodinium microadriaticum]